MLEKYYRINEAAGVSILLKQDGSVAFSACKVSIQNKQLEILAKTPAASEVSQLKKQLPANTFVALNIGGRGVLYKQLDKLDEIHAGNFNQVLPNANFDDFYVQHFISGSQSFVSVIRKTEAQKWIDQLKDAGFQPLMLSLGPFPVQHILPQINLYDNTVIFHGYTVTRNEQKEWTTWAYDAKVSSQFPLKAGLEALDERLLLPYASAFQLAMAGKLESVNIQDGPLEQTFSAVLGDRRFRAQGAFILMVFFVLLLINFGLFSWLNTSDTALSQRVSLSAQSTSDIQKINQDIAEKQALLDTLGWEGETAKSTLIDQLASLLPPQLTISEIAVDPQDVHASRSQRAIAFEQKTIRVTGTSENIIPVNEWIARIKTRPWLKNIRLDNYAYNSELNTGQFTILIHY